MGTGMNSVCVFVGVALLGLTGASAAQEQDIEWGIADELTHSRRPPEGMMYPGEMKLAGLRTITVGEPLRTDQARQAFRARRHEAAHRQRRLIFNNDGDDAMTVPKSQPATAESLLLRRTSALVGSQVDSIFYCSLCGPRSYHPSKVSEVYTNPMELYADYYGQDSREGQYFARVKNVVPDLIAQGTDPLKVMVEFSRAHNLEIFCSMRMNDTHDGANRPDKPYPNWPRFKQEHPEYLVGSLEKRPPATALMATEKQFRRIIGYQELWILKAVLDETVAAEKVAAA